jgi:hypothetical protein
MGTMTQKWTMPQIISRLDKKTEVAFDEGKLTDALFDICQEIASKARSGHTYMNIKGELESSIGVVVLKDREEIKRWDVSSTSGKDPALGIIDFQNALEQFVLGKSELPDGTHIPEIGLVGIVFAAAPYAGTVEARGRTVLDYFKPDAGYVFDIIKTAII